MTRRPAATRLAVAALAVLAVAGCASHPAPASRAAARPVPDLVLTTALMPKAMTGWTATATGDDPLLRTQINLNGPHRTPRPASALSCEDLAFRSIAAVVEVPVDESGATISGPGGWSGIEEVLRYDPGVATATLAAIRGLTTRCADQNGVAVTDDNGPDLGDDSLALHRTVSGLLVYDPNEYTIFIRSGDDLIAVNEADFDATADTSAAWSAATAAYNAYARA